MAVGFGWRVGRTWGAAMVAAGARRWLLRAGRAQGMVEYSLILMLIAIVVLAVLILVGHHVSDLYSNINNGVATASG